jgi:hypothetical protein
VCDIIIAPTRSERGRESEKVTEREREKERDKREREKVCAVRPRQRSSALNFHRIQTQINGQIND